MADRIADPPPPFVHPPYWTIPRDIEGGTAFIIGGGPSLLEVDFAKLRAWQNELHADKPAFLAINSSYKIAPWAEYLMISDPRWWWEYAAELTLSEFRGQVISLMMTEHRIGMLALRRYVGKGLCPLANGLNITFTTTTAAIDFWAHRGCKRIALLGIDGQDRGHRTHHHGGYPKEWKRPPNNYREHGKAIAALIPSLDKQGIRVVFATPSAHKMFPYLPLDELMRRWA